MKLALHVIVKDEIDQVKRILMDYYKYFDAVDIAVDYKFEEFSKLIEDYPNLSVYQYEWCNDFSHKRNFLASKCKCPYYFRMDCDDAVINPDRIRECFENMVKSDASILYALYEYAHDDDGNVIAAHNRDVIIKNVPNLFWNKAIHENVLPKDTANYRTIVEQNFRIKHLAKEGHALDSALRNIKYLIDEYNKDGENTDLRTIAYLGRNFLAVNDIDKAMFFLVKHIAKSGWDEDRYQSRCQLAECHIKKDEIEEAKLCCMEAILEIPSSPDAYLKLHEIYFEQGRWKEAIHWGEEGLRRNPNMESMMIIDPSAYTWRPSLTLAYSYFQINEFEKAKKLFDFAKKYSPNFPFIRDNAKMFEDGVAHKSFAEKFLYLANYLKHRDHGKVKTLFECIPTDMEDNAYLINARNKMLPPKYWDQDSIVIYCGPVLDEWADPSVITGIGGSEEAVIYLSREFVKLGRKVYVYNGCGDMEGEYNGVTYINYQKFNPKDIFGTLISWRTSIFGFPIKAKKKLVWFHDVFPTKGLPQSHVDNLDYVIVLSLFHRTLLPSFVPESKIVISSNGINPTDFMNYGVKREPHRCIYASSYDRGLEHLLTVWPDVRKAVPDAELHIFYGWNNIDKLIKTGDYHLLTFKNKMMPLINQPGVFENGRVGHIELIKEYQRSHVFSYPCSYEEISCIASMKAQLCGCVSVTTDFAALAETSKTGIKVKGKGGTNNEEYTQALINALNAPMKSSVDYTPITWKDVAETWLQYV